MLIFYFKIDLNIFADRERSVVGGTKIEWLLLRLSNKWHKNLNDNNNSNNYNWFYKHILLTNNA